MFIVYQLGTIRFEKRKMHSSIEISVDLVKLNWKGVLIKEVRCLFTLTRVSISL